VRDASEEAILTEEQPFKIVDIDDPDDMELENYVSDASFQNHSQNENLPSAESFKCKMCNFSSTKKCVQITTRKKIIIGAHCVIQALVVNKT
jgi:hypothetical protein